MCPLFCFCCLISSASALRLVFEKPGGGGGTFGNSCVNPTQPNVAICVAGIGHHVDKPQVYESFLHANAKIQQAGGQGLARAEPDVFLVWKTSTPASNVRHAENAATNFEVIKAAAPKWNPTDTNLDPTEGAYAAASFNQDEVVANPKCFHGNAFTRDVSVNHGMNQHASYRVCHELMEKHEAETGKQYDIVVIHRPDLLFTHKLNELSCNSATFHRDWYFAMPRKGSHYFKDLLQDSFLNRNPASGYCNAHNSEAMFGYTATLMQNDGISASYKPAAGRAGYHLYGHESA